MRASLFLSALLAASLVACSNDDGGRAGTSPSKEEASFEEARSALARDTTATLADTEEKTFATSNADFALRLHKAQAKPKAGAAIGNAAFSPYSISTALAMLYAGARGETATQMESALHFDLHERTHVGMNQLERTLESRRKTGNAIDGGPLELAVNNAIFVQKGFPFEPAYLDLLAAQYGTGVKLADFKANPDAETKKINDWVAVETKYRIRDLVPGLASNTRSVLVNTVYLNAAWANPFLAEQTTDGSFNNEDGSIANVKMMNGMAQTVASTDAVDLVSLPYSGGALTMIAILPKQGTLSDFEQALDVQSLDTLLDARHPASTPVVLPRFKIAGESVDLNAVLEDLGMKLAFDEHAANFSGISSEPLFVSSVVHKAFIDVGEKGTEAAAATAIAVAPACDCPPPTTITFDHPFFVLIRDEATKSILFTARVAQL